MKKKDPKSRKINEQVRRERAARRQIEIELQLPKEHAKVHQTTKKDQLDKQSNTIKPEDYED